MVWNLYCNFHYNKQKNIYNIFLFVNSRWSDKLHFNIFLSKFDIFLLTYRQSCCINKSKRLNSKGIQQWNPEVDSIKAFNRKRKSKTLKLRRNTCKARKGHGMNNTRMQKKQYRLSLCLKAVIIAMIGLLIAFFGVITYYTHNDVILSASIFAQKKLCGF